VSAYDIRFEDEFIVFGEELRRYETLLQWTHWRHSHQLELWFLESDDLSVATILTRESDHYQQEILQGRLEDALARRMVATGNWTISEANEALARRIFAPTNSGWIRPMLVSNPVSGNGELCSICLETQDAATIVAALPCGHRFHYPCVTEWARAQVSTGVLTCAVCRSPKCGKYVSQSYTVLS